MLNGVRHSGYAAWAVLVGLLAASVSALFWARPAFLFPKPASQAGNALEDLAQATAGTRLTVARLHGPFSWAVRPTPDRGSPARTLPLPALEAAATIEGLAAARRTPESLNALGVSLLAAGRIDEGVETLEETVALAPGDARARNDLAAAYFERWRRDRIAMDAARALNEAELAARTSTTSAPAAFNAALSTQALASPRAAIRAWQQYLKIDPSSDWAGEARGYLGELEQHVSPTPLSPEELKSDSRLIEIARTNTHRLYRFLDHIVPDETLDADANARDLAARTKAVSAALRHTKRDNYRPDLTDAIAAAPGWLPARRRCLIAAMTSIAESGRHFDGSDYTRAATAASQASTQFRCAGFTTIDADMQRAWAMFFGGHRPDALALARPSAASADARGYHRPVGRYHYMNGLWLLGIGKMTDAVTEYRLAIDAFTRAGDTELIVSAEALLAEAFKEQGDPDLGWRHLQTALSKSDVLSPRRRYLVLSQALLAATQGGLDGAALAFLDELSAVTREWNQSVADIDVSLRRARLLSRIGRTDEAKDAIGKARATLARLPAGSARSYAADLAWTEGLTLQQVEPASAVAALTAAHNALADLNLPFRLAEVLLARGRAFRAQGQLKKAEQDWERGLEILEDQRPGIREEQLKVSRTSELWDLYAELIDIRAGDPAAALRTAERSRARALIELRASGPVSPAQSGVALDDLVPAGTTALVYAVLPARLLVWCVRRGSVQLHVRSVGASRLERLVERYIAHLRSAKSLVELDELSALLLPPDLPRGAEATLAFLPDGPLHRIPFGSLKNPSTGRAVASEFIPVVAPSLSLMQTKSTSGPVRPDAALLIGVATARAEPRLAFLPEVAGEIDDLVRLYPRHTVLDERSATAARILDGLSRSGVVHFAGHAIADERYPARSRLMVARGPAGDTLTASDLAGVRLPPGAVVVLGACQTAGGRVFRGEGVMSLARPFLVGGASAVVASLWPVDDRTSRRLLHEFHTRLRAGDSPARALAMSQRLLSGNTPVAQWSAFQVLVAQ